MKFQLNLNKYKSIKVSFYVSVILLILQARTSQDKGRKRHPT